MRNLLVKYESTIVGLAVLLFMGMGVWGQAGKSLEFGVNLGSESNGEPKIGMEAGSLEGRYSVSPSADRLLRLMGDYLKGAEDFTFHAEVSYDALLSNDQMVQYGGHVDAVVSKPGRVYAIYEGDERRTRTSINEGVFTVYDMNRGVYSWAKVPKVLDEAVDEIVDRYGFNIPLADLMYLDPYAVMIENVVSGFVVGESEVDGVRCHHLAFVQEGIDWQVWIEMGPYPLPRKVVITYKESVGAPQYMARLSRWNLAPTLGANSFELIVPADADEIDFLVNTFEEAE